MSSKISRKIKNKDKPNDIFITPIDLAKLHISKIKSNDNEVWYDPFKNNGSYYNHFKTDNKTWSEILEDKDFFKFNEKIDVICSNPPYSIIDKVLEKSVSLNPRIISYLIGYGNVTAKRLEYMELNGYKIIYFHLTKVYQWYGMSTIIIWEKNNSTSIINFDRTVWK